MRDTRGQRCCHPCLPDVHVLTVAVRRGRGGFRIVRECAEHGTQAALTGPYPTEADARSLIRDREGAPVCVECRGRLLPRSVRTARGFVVAGSCPRHGVMEAIGTGWFSTSWLAEHAYADAVSGEALTPAGEPA